MFCLEVQLSTGHWAGHRARVAAARAFHLSAGWTWTGGRRRGL
jgi:hypothetical protein